jgi:hypothetical protein
MLLLQTAPSCKRGTPPPLSLTRLIHSPTQRQLHVPFQPQNPQPLIFPQAEALTHSHRMRSVTRRLVNVSRVLSASPGASAASTSPHDNDLSIDLGLSAHGSTHTNTLQSFSSVSALRTENAPEEIELSVLSPATVSAAANVSLTSPACPDDEAPSRMSISSNLVPRLEHDPDATDRDSMNCSHVHTPIPILQPIFVSNNGLFRRTSACSPRRLAQPLPLSPPLHSLLLAKQNYSTFSKRRLQPKVLFCFIVLYTRLVDIAF